MSVSCNMFRFQTWAAFGAHCDFCRPTVTLRKRSLRISYYKPLKLQCRADNFSLKHVWIWDVCNGILPHSKRRLLEKGNALVSKINSRRVQNRKVHYCVRMNLTLDCILNQMNPVCRSQWPRDLRCGSAVARLLGLWVRIPSGAWRSVTCECCIL
jgi:hypothetical protein